MPLPPVRQPVASEAHGDSSSALSTGALEGRRVAPEPVRALLRLRLLRGIKSGDQAAVVVQHE